MKLKNFTRWVEITANLAVVISVIFLSLEIRNNTKTIESQSIIDRSQRVNQSFTNSQLIPSILAKIKAVDGSEPMEVNFMNHYNLTYEEAAIWARYLAEIFAGLEAEFLRDGQSQDLQERIQLYFIFPDCILFWDSGHAQVQNEEFVEYVDGVRKLPLPRSISDYKKNLDTLRIK